VRQDKERVKGLTTAAAIWVVAAIGLACGAGLLLEAITATILALIVLIILRYIEQLMLLRAITTHHLHVEVASEAVGAFLSNMHDSCIRRNIKVNELRIQPNDATEMITLVCDSKERAELLPLVTELRALNGVRMIKTDLAGTSKRDK
jgi:putative Mg2+ transporter-C (MgtC) family protein